MTKSATREAADGELFKSTGIDDNATSTAVTIDASENVMVGQTSVNTANNGHSFGANGNYAHHTSTESTTLILNRKTSNGDIVRLRKDNAAVGSIGTLGGATYFGSAESGIMFNGVNQNPTNGTSTRVDNTNDLGASSYRYKDIYLGGGAFLGGTATANKLSDYETGTWTPALVNGTNQPVGTSITTVTYASYTKIGRQVIVYLYCDGMNFNSSAAAFQIGGLPFAPKGGQYGGGSFGYTHNFNVATKHFMVLVNSSGTIYFHRGDGNSSAATNADFAGCSYMLLSANYITDA